MAIVLDTVETGPLPEFIERSLDNLKKATSVKDAIGQEDIYAPYHRRLHTSLIDLLATGTKWRTPLHVRSLLAEHLLGVNPGIERQIARIDLDMVYVNELIRGGLDLANQKLQALLNQMKQGDASEHEGASFHDRLGSARRIFPQFVDGVQIAIDPDSIADYQDYLDDVEFTDNRLIAETFYRLYKRSAKYDEDGLLLTFPLPWTQRASLDCENAGLRSTKSFDVDFCEAENSGVYLDRMIGAPTALRLNVYHPDPFPNLLPLQLKHVGAVRFVNGVSFTPRVIGLHVGSGLSKDHQRPSLVTWERTDHD